MDALYHEISVQKESEVILMNMTIGALLLIVGTNILVGGVQLFLFIKNVRAADELNELSAKYLAQITETSMKNISEAGVRVGKLLDALEPFFKK